MIHTKKTVSIILTLALIFTLCTVAFAAGGATTYSEDGVKFIEEFEGYSQYVYEDKLAAGVYSVGYGTVCGKDDYPEGVSQPEAEKLLTDYLDVKVVPELNKFLTANAITLNQNQYNALCSFTYNLGSGWMSGTSRVATYLKNGIANYTDAQIVDAIGVFGHVGSTPIEGLVNRRIREAQAFLYGDYTGKNSTQYNWLIVNRAGGSLENDIFCFEAGKTYGALPVPTLEGKYFAGWQNDATGTTMSATAAVTGNVHATATWSDKIIMPYADVADTAWYRDAVAYCYVNNLMGGTGATQFAPDLNMTRAMLVTVLWRMAGQPTVNYLMPFTDGETFSWATEAIRWAASEGIVTGTSATTFSPAKDVTREQMVAILYRFAQKQGKVNDFDSGSMGLAGYMDASSISAYAQPAFLWAVQTGVIQGTSTAAGIKLTPKATATRAQVAQVLQNYGMI